MKPITAEWVAKAEADFATLQRVRHCVWRYNLSGAASNGKKQS